MYNEHERDLSCVGWDEKIKMKFVRSTMYKARGPEMSSKTVYQRKGVV